MSETSSQRRISRAAGATTALVGAGVLVGWMLDVDVLKSVLPGFVTMKANTALSFLLAGASLWWGNDPGSRRAQRLATLCALVPVLVGALTLAEYLLGADLRIDRLLAAEGPGAVGTSAPGRMASTAALNLLLLGAALLLLDRETRDGRRPAEALAIVATLVSALAIVGYAYGAPSLRGLAGHTQMAIHTAAAFVVLAVGVLFSRPERGLMQIISGDTAGGALARRMLPLVIAAPFMLGWLSLQGQRAGAFDGAVGLSFVVVVSVVPLAAVVVSTAATLAEADLLRRKVEETSRKWGHVFEHAGWGVTVGSADGTTLELMNPEFARMHGYTVAELSGRPIRDVFAPEVRAGLEEQIRTVHEKGHHAFESLHARKDGAIFPVYVDAAIVTDEAGRVRYRVVNVQDITDRKRAEVALRQAKDAADAANRELEAFSYSVSHDLRAPLRGIDGFSQALLEDYADEVDDEGKRYLGYIRESARHMAQLIDDLLTLARVTRSELRRERVDLSALARAAIGRLQRAQPHRRPEVVVQEGLVGEGDPRLLAVVFDNLLGNAWKFTGRRERARIEVSAASDGKPAVYFVRDNGAGFDMAYAGKLFGVFQRLHGAGEFEGTGVGLATVQRIIHRHGGRVWADGQPERGATFYFTLSTEEPGA